MIVNETIKEMYWVLDKSFIVEKYENRLKYVSDEEVVANEDEVVHFGYKLLMFPFLKEDGTLREATDKELIDKGICSLAENEVLVGDSVKFIYEFPVPEGMAKPVFNKETLKWEETATAEEIAEYAFKQSVSFYNSELDFASKATAELVCEIITPEMYEDVKSYMKAIDPYAPKKMSARKLKAISRPSVFDRYN